MQFSFVINNTNLAGKEYKTPFTGNVNSYQCLFEINSDIKNLQWFCVFSVDDNCYVQHIVDNACYIPKEVLLSENTIKIGCYATNMAENDYKRISTNWLYFKSLEGAYTDGTLPEIPEPDVWETLVSKAVPIIGENGNWYTYDMEIGDYVDTGVSAGGDISSIQEELENKADKTEVYTKDEVDNKIGSVYRACGTKTTSTLPYNPNLGDVYNLSVSGENNPYGQRNDVVINIFQNEHIVIDELYVNEKYMYITNTRGVELLSHYPTNSEREDWENNRVILVTGIDNETNTTYNVMLDAYVDSVGDGYAIVKWKQNYWWDGAKEEYYNELEISAIEWEFKVADGDNVVWTDTGWDKLSGTIDTSNFATKEDIGDIETALDNIIAIQDDLIGGDGV